MSQAKGTSNRKKREKPGRSHKYILEVNEISRNLRGFS
jgi:hypothetical protein